ncbi:MAG: hypothetical protein AYK22_07035 [Thermoplasmatales archaeon SG8-52-3]|nr:MAG: hypothetical protein AYK22_07035 [Thermoplasmatales archaeon SG8-52-3]
MKIEIEDIVFGSLALISIVIWYFMLMISNSPLLSIMFLWVAMILISILYLIVYRKKKRDKKILRIRFLASGIPLYPTMIYYFYKLLFSDGLPKEQKLLPLFILLPALFINGIILLLFDIRKKK